MRVVIAGSRPPKTIADDTAKMEKWFEEHYAILDATIPKCPFALMIEVLVATGEVEGWDYIAKYWAMSNDKEFACDQKVGKRVLSRKDLLGVADATILLWDGKDAEVRGLIVEAEKVMEPECVWVEVVDV